MGQSLAFTGQGSKAASSPPLPLVCQVSLVPHQHDDDIASSLCPHVINPLGGLLERIQVCREEANGSAKENTSFQTGGMLCLYPGASPNLPTPQISDP